jgi:succinoglycan biosynthesis protein ExoA
MIAGKSPYVAEREPACFCPRTASSTVPQPAANQMRVSVIVPCRNEKSHIRDFLDSLLAQDLDPDWKLEILVADGMSDDGTRDVLRQYSAERPAVRIIDNPGRIVSTGLNAAIRASSGDVIVRMDAHTVYRRDYIRECVRALHESGADNVGGPWVAEGRGRVGKAIAAAFRSPFCTGGGKAHDPCYEGEVDTVYLGCWRRSVFDRAGLFDPALVRNQDDEFNYRLLRMGGRVWQSPRIQSVYTPRSSMAALFRQYVQYGFWKVVVIRKHRALAAWRHAVPPLFVASLLLAVVLAPTAAALGAARVAQWIGAALGLEAVAYLLACAAASLPLASSLDAGTLLILPAVMAVYHVAYGLGFLAGLLRPAMMSGLFTGLTR